MEKRIITTKLLEAPLLKNSAWLLGAQVFIKTVSFFYTIFLAQSLGVGNFGNFVAALSYFSLVSSLADFGVTRFLLREISLGEEKLNKLLFNTIFFRMSLLSVFFLAFLIFLGSIDPDAARRSLAILAVLAVLPQSISMTLDAAFIARSKAKYSAIGMLFLSLLTTLSGVILITLGFGATGAVIALVAGQLFYALVLILISLNQKMEWSGIVDLKFLKKVIKGSLPYGFLGILGLLYFKIDALMLSYIKGSFSTGIYGAAYKFLESIVFIPATLATVLFPTLAKLHGHDTARIKRIYLKSVTSMVGLGLLTLLGYIFILPTIIKFFLPSYLASIDVVKILALSIPFMFVHVPASQVLLSAEKYLRPIIIFSIGTVTFNIAANLIFIPHYGYIAAAWITVASDVVSCVGLLYFINRYVFENA